ncbi:superoxide dismutase family protein [Dietzia sp.]|uniref:superoxide dismutase family protein n=1 Tax=Dietzia sp. TaxID=1871616 RepID=UPI002FD9C26E
MRSTTTDRRPRQTRTAGRLAFGLTSAAALMFAAACSSDDGGSSEGESSNAAGSSAEASAASSSDAAEPAATAKVANDEGAELGTVSFAPQGSEVEVTANITGLEPGFYGFHIHDTGKCDPHAMNDSGEHKAFNSAGGHLNPDKKDHPEHAGDMPPLLVGENGEAHASFTTDRFSVEQLTGGEGTAVMIHAGADNFANIPEHYAPTPDEETLKTGDAGARAGCGVVEG